MTLSRWLLRLLAPACEKQRMEFRHGLAKVEAYTEDLMRTVRIDPQKQLKAKQ